MRGAKKSGTRWQRLAGWPLHQCTCQFVWEGWLLGMADAWIWNFLSFIIYTKSLATLHLWLLSYRRKFRRAARDVSSLSRLGWERCYLLSSPLPSLCWRKSYLLSSQPRFWWGKTGQISGYSPGSQFPILLVQSLLEALLSQTDLTSSPIWTLHFHKCHNNEAGDEVFKVSSLVIGLFIKTVLVADRKWVETRFVYYFFLVVTSLMLHISANMFWTFIYIYHIHICL